MSTEQIVNTRISRQIVQGTARDEDGNLEERCFLYLEAHDRRGRVWAHTASVVELTSQNDWDEEEAKLERLAANVERKGSIDTALWGFDRWSYGSEGWDAQERHNEIRDAEIAGERHPMADYR